MAWGSGCALRLQVELQRQRRPQDHSGHQLAAPLMASDHCKPPRATQSFVPTITTNGFPSVFTTLVIASAGSTERLGQRYIANLVFLDDGLG